MLEYLQQIDQAALLQVNGWHNAFMDQMWWLVSAKWSWAFILVVFVWILLHKNRRQALLVVVMIALAVLLADQISSSLIKGAVERLRPTRDPSLSSLVHVVNDYRGGMYGFVSSHAANSFAIAMLLSLMMRHRLVTWSLFIWATLQCYSRVYLGVHYPGDILGGIVVGLVVGWAVWLLWRYLCHRWRLNRSPFTTADARHLMASVIITVVAIVAASCVQTLGLGQLAII